MRNIVIEPGREPNISEEVIWRLTDMQEPSVWRVSLGVDFVTLETSRYSSRDDFLARLRTVLEIVEANLQPASAQRVGLRYIDRLEGKAMDRLSDLIQPSVLGIVHSDQRPTDSLRKSTAHSMTHALIQA